MSFWKGKKVFITGHTGFKGSWLCLWLRRLGADVTGYALHPATDPNLFELCSVKDFVHSVIADIRDKETLTTALSAAQPDIVFHMAAQPLVRESYRSPVDTYSTNVMGTVNLLEAVRGCRTIKSVVNVTTDKCYENREWAWGYRENEAMGGYDPYSSSKGCAELVTAAYRNSFFNPADYDKHGVALATARAGNVIGGGDWADERLIPDCIRALLQGKEIVIRSPGAIRPWQHVLEPLSGYLLLARRMYQDGVKYSGAWNFGPGDNDARPVEWLVQKMCAAWGNGSSYRVDGSDHPHEAHYLKLDCSKARHELGWQPRWRLETAIEKIIEWSLAFQNKRPMPEICLEQIQAYSKDVGI